MLEWKHLPKWCIPNDATDNYIPDGVNNDNDDDGDNDNDVD